MFLRNSFEKVEELADSTYERFFGPVNLYESYVNRFGNKETILMHNEKDKVFHKLIEVQKNPHYYFDYKQQTRHLEDLTSYLKKEKVFK